jgi:hypothetical protein
MFFRRDTQALLAVLTPFRTAKINFRIDDDMPALAAFELWLVLEKLDGMTAASASNLKNIFRLPKPLILSGTLNHHQDSTLFIFVLDVCAPFPLFILTDLRVYERIIVSSILNLFPALTECGTLAGIMIIWPCDTSFCSPAIVIQAFPSRICTTAS